MLASLFLVTFLSVGSAFKCQFTGTANDQEKLQVHIVPHTHDDVGWLKTVDEYFYGANNSIQHAGVQYILDSVIPQLSADPSKKFIYAEIAFFDRWWREQTPAMQAEVKKLVKEKRLEFINAGWCMNDEAATHYNAIIDQMTYGLSFVEETFGPEARPRIAWHIDPFGHSNEQASLFAQMSFDGFFFGRIDYADKKLRLEEQRMELVWRGSRNLANSDIFTGVLYNGYNPPKGFCYDQFCVDPPIQDDPNLFDVNVKERVDKFVETTCEQASHYKTNHIMLTMGSDFMYENANLWFKNLDKLIKYVNQDGRVNVFYSTPTIYLDALHSANQTWELKTDDFFPYADCPWCYWTGYFTSRPALKRYVRLNNNLLQVCKQLELIRGPSQQNSYSSDTLRRAMGVAQHHDAVSGTSKQHVADDYAKRLAIGAVECQGLIREVLGKFTVKNAQTNPPNLTFCDHLNISSCAVSEQSKSFTVTLYNPIARDVTSVVRLPVGTSTMAVFDPQGASVRSQVMPISPETTYLRQVQNQGQSSSEYEIVFSATVPALGFATYFVNSTTPSHLKRMFHHGVKRVHSDATDIDIENEFIKLSFSQDTGRLTSMTDLPSKLTTAVDQEFYWYNGSTGNKISGQPSGAYIFRPNSSSVFDVSKDNKAQIQIFKGPVVQEVRQVFSPYVSQVIRLYAGQRHAEFEYTVGPIPIADGLGKEVIARFDTDIKSDQLYYTDANGREMQERKRDYRPTWTLNNTEPVAGNYYPVNSRMYVKDDNRQFTVLTDRSLGGASLKDGSLEIMVHRRLLKDDKRGVNEPLNELGVSGKGLIVRGKLCVTLAPPKSSAALHRELGEELLLEPLLAFAPNDLTFKQWTSQYNAKRSGLKRELPPNVHLLTLEAKNENLLIRVEHQFEAGEDAKLSQPVNISLANLFIDFDIESMTEMNLSANQLLKDKHPLHWNIKKTKTAQEKKKNKNRKSRNASDMNVQLSPMEIRTFLAVIKRHGSSQEMNY